jgi:hypothetical protein
MLEPTETIRFQRLGETIHHMACPPGELVCVPDTVVINQHVYRTSSLIGEGGELVVDCWDGTECMDGIAVSVTGEIVEG